MKNYCKICSVFDIQLLVLFDFSDFSSLLFVFLDCAHYYYLKLQLHMSCIVSSTSDVKGCGVRMLAILMCYSLRYGQNKLKKRTISLRIHWIRRQLSKETIHNTHLTDFLFILFLPFLYSVHCVQLSSDLEDPIKFCRFNTFYCVREIFSIWCANIPKYQIVHFDWRYHQLMADRLHV